MFSSSNPITRNLRAEATSSKGSLGYKKVLLSSSGKRLQHDRTIFSYIFTYIKFTLSVAQADRYLLLKSFVCISQIRAKPQSLPDIFLTKMFLYVFCSVAEHFAKIWNTSLFTNNMTVLNGRRKRCQAFCLFPAV